jgi:UDP-GlcNAc:undecaprenyl-phosphate GlcNAc-1-phosphate transferase
MLSDVFLNAAAGFVLCATATPLVRALARRVGAVAQPKSDRWHQAPTAMLGGVAIFIAVVAAVLARVRPSREMWVVLGGSAVMFFFGLIDDFFRLKPYQKLCGQLLSAAAIVYLGLVLPWTGSSALNMLITFFWLVGVTNAVNMLDNMDGLAAGVAAIASLSLAVNFLLAGQTNAALMLLVFFGALVGFLIYNHNPASIFMGDCGSMFIGFFLACSALLSEESGGGRSRSVIAALAVPVLVLCIPIFDTTFVTLARKLAGRAASQGGRDHTSHRLVALGLSERHAVWMLWTFSLLGGSLAILVRHLGLDVSLAAIVGFVIVLAILGVYLAGVRVYGEEEIAAAGKKPIVTLLIDLSYKRRIFEVGLDVVLIMLAHYVAYALTFGPGDAASVDWQLFMKTLPAIVFVKLLTFLATGMYRGLWRYMGLTDLVGMIKSVTLSSVTGVLMVVILFRFDGFSRTAFALDGILLLGLIVGSRAAFRLLRNLLPVPHARTGKRVLIFGAGDGGELLCRELMNNTELGYVPAAFVDDDRRKFGSFLHGLRVYPGDEPLDQVCRNARIDEVFLSTLRIPVSRFRALVAECERIGVPVKRMKFEIQRIADEDLGWVLPSGVATSEPTAADLAAPPLLPIESPRRPRAVSH